MSKAAKKSANQPEPTKLSKEKILAATRVTLSTASTTLTVEQLNSELFRVFLAKKLAGLAATKDDLHKVVVYGKAEAFKVDSVEGPEQPSETTTTGHIFSDDTSILVLTAAQTAQQDPHSSSDALQQQLAVDCPKVCPINEKIAAELRQYVELHRDATVSHAHKFSSLLLLGGEKTGKTTLLKLLLKELAESRDSDSPVEVKYQQLSKSTNLNVPLVSQ